MKNNTVKRSSLILTFAVLFAAITIMATVISCFSSCEPNVKTETGTGKQTGTATGGNRNTATQTGGNSNTATQTGGNRNTGTQSRTTGNAATGQDGTNDPASSLYGMYYSGSDRFDYRNDGYVYKNDVKTYKYGVTDDGRLRMYNSLNESDGYNDYEYSVGADGLVYNNMTLSRTDPGKT